MITLSQKVVDEIGKLVDTTKDWNELERSVYERMILYEYNRGKDVIGQNYIILGACYAALQMPADEKKDRVKEEDGFDIWNSIISTKKPATIVKKDEIEYHIHGLVHLPSRAKYFASLAYSNYLICEPGITIIFESNSSLAQTRISECKYTPFFEYAGKNIFRGLFPVLYLKAGLWLTKKNVIKNRERLFCEDAIFNGGRAGLSEREVIRVDSPNGKAIINIEDILLPERHMHTYVESELNKKKKKLIMLRSLSQAEFLEDMAKNMQLKRAHGVYGLLHEPQIAYFLRYPEKTDELKHRFAGNPLRTAAHAVAPLHYPLIGGLMTYYFGKEFLQSWSDDSSIFWTGLVGYLALKGIGRISNSVLTAAHNYKNLKKVKEIQNQARLFSS